MKKKDLQKSVKDFKKSVKEIEDFVKHCQKVGLTDKYVSWSFDLAIIRLYREFENLILNCLVGLINNDSSTFSEHKGFKFPKHMNVKVCEYLVRGDNYFNFSGYSGLIKEIRKFVPSTNHTCDNNNNDSSNDSNNGLLGIVKKSEYKDSLNQLIALRNFAAHNSSGSKEAALKYTDRKGMSSSGAWLKRKEPGCPEIRFTKICESLKAMAKEIEEEVSHQKPHDDPAPHQKPHDDPTPQEKTHRGGPSS